MIHLKEVCKTFEGHTILKNISFKLEQGDMAFITGRSGAGKTTLLNIISHVDQCTSGQITVNGMNLNRIKARQIPYFRRKIGIVFQDYRLLADRTVYDNVALPLVVCSTHHQDVERRVRGALNRVGLGHKASCYPDTLSGGEKQRIGIARAVVNKPDIILADEPTGNLDPDLSADIMSLFEQLNQLGTTVLVASHDINLIGQMGYPIITLNEGKLDHDPRQVAYA